MVAFTRGDVMRLIDADALKAVFEEKSSEAVCGVELCKAIISRIDEAPTVDAVPVIHCKDCGARMDGDPNGFNDETVQALKDTTDRKNLSKVYETLDDMYADMDGSEWREYIYRVRETADGIDSDCMAELIRCEKCKWWNTTDGMVKGFDGRQWNECQNLGVPTDEWFFCRDAERREDER